MIRSLIFLAAAGAIILAGPGSLNGQDGEDDGETFANKTYDYFPRDSQGNLKFPELKPDCSHIKFITGEDSGLAEKVHEEYRNLLVPPKPYQKKLVILALNELPEFICKSVGGIALYDPTSTALERKSPLVQTQFPDVININVALTETWQEEGLMAIEETYPTSRFYYTLRAHYDRWPKAMATVIHEAGHCAALLLESQTKQTWQINKIPTPWPEAVQSKAKKIIDDTGLEDGFLDEWERVHESFENEGLAAEYVDDSRPADRTLPSEKGFLTNYAQRKVMEDITETISVFTIESSSIKSGEYADELIYHGAKGTKEENGIKSPPEMVSPFNHTSVYKLVTPTLQSWQDPCGAMKNRQQVGVDENWAAVFTKMMFLIDLKLIDENLYSKCAGLNGPPKLRPNYDKTENGWHRVDRENGNRPYTHRTIAPGFPVDRSEAQVFKIVGDGVLNTDEGNSYDQTMTLTFFNTKKPAIPRGYYQFGSGPLRTCMSRIFASNPLSSKEYVGFTLQVPTAPSKSFCASAGYVWVTRASKNFIEAKMVISRAWKKVGVFAIPEVPNFVVYLRWKRPGTSDDCSAYLPCPVNQ